MEREEVEGREKGCCRRQLLASCLFASEFQTCIPFPQQRPRAQECTCIRQDYSVTQVHRWSHMHMTGL